MMISDDVNKSSFRAFHIMKFQSKKRKWLEYIKSTWGREIKKYRNFDLISVYHRMKSQKEELLTVDENTCNSLEMNKIFSKLDATLSCAGQQYMYHMMRTYNKNPEQLNAQYKKYVIFQNRQDLRESVQLALMEMKNDSAYRLPELIFNENQKRIKYDYLLFILSLLSLNSLFLVPFYNYFLLIFLFFGIINIIVNRIFSSQIYEHISELSALDNLLKAAIQISKIKDTHGIQEVSTIKNNIKPAFKIRKKIGWLILNKSQLNELVAVFIEYLNQLCLYDLMVYIKSFKSIKKHRESLEELYDAVASLDYIIAMSSLLQRINEICKPEFTENTIEFDGIYHPLLENPVPNSIKLDTNSILITGSNMAGKTTFIKTAGINSILSQTIGVAFARSLKIPIMRVFASIKIEENMLEGKSYYMAEIEELLRFISKVQSDKKTLFIIDEIFRGTNTTERVSAAAAVLKYLNSSSYVFVTTHDVELRELLEDKYALYNFSERLNGDRVFFDYKIHPGPCLSRNAIKLLETKGYPKEIINEALNISTRV